MLRGWVGNVASGKVWKGPLLSTPFDDTFRAAAVVSLRVWMFLPGSRPLLPARWTLRGPSIPLERGQLGPDRLGFLRGTRQKYFWRPPIHTNGHDHPYPRIEPNREDLHILKWHDPPTITYDKTTLNVGSGRITYESLAGNRPNLLAEPAHSGRAKGWGRPEHSQSPPFQHQPIADLP